MLRRARVALVVVVDRVVADRDPRPVERIAAGAERFLDVARGEADDAAQAPALAVVREEREAVLRGELVLREAEAPEAQLVLDEIHEAQSAGAGGLERLLARGVVERDDVQVGVVAEDRPVEQDLAVRQARVVEHLPRVHGRAGTRRVVAVARRGAVELGRVVARGPGDRPVRARPVVLQDRADGQVLDDVARGRDAGLFARDRVRLEADVEGGPRPREDVAEVGAVDHDPCADLDGAAVGVREHRAAHGRALPPQLDEAVAQEDAQIGLRGRHLREDPRGHVRLEVRV